MTNFEAINEFMAQNFDVVFHLASVIPKYDKKPPEIKLNRRPDFRLTHNNKTLFINVDGLYDHCEGGRRNPSSNYHFDLRQEFTKNNLRIFQFRADEINNKLEIIKSIVLNYFRMSDRKIPARKCQIKKITSLVKKKFFEKNHSMGDHPKSIGYGLFLEEELISVMSIRKINKGIDISRFSTKINLNVMGGFSKLLKHIERERNPKFIQSYLDLRYSTGVSYDKCGFELDKTHISWKWTDLRDTYNRLKCRANMDSRRLTQKQHAEELKWYRIYDAGQSKYVKKLW